MNAASYIDAKWDKVIDLFMRRTVYGALTGGAAGVLLCSEERRREMCA